MHDTRHANEAETVKTYGIALGKDVLTAIIKPELRSLLRQKADATFTQLSRLERVPKALPDFLEGLAFANNELSDMHNGSRETVTALNVLQLPTATAYAVYGAAERLAPVIAEAFCIYWLDRSVLSGCVQRGELTLEVGSQMYRQYVELYYEGDEPSSEDIELGVSSIVSGGACLTSHDLARLLHRVANSKGIKGVPLEVVAMLLYRGLILKT